MEKLVTIRVVCEGDQDFAFCEALLARLSETSAKTVFGDHDSPYSKTSALREKHKTKWGRAHIKRTVKQSVKFEFGGVDAKDQIVVNAYSYVFVEFIEIVGVPRNRPDFFVLLCDTDREQVLATVREAIGRCYSTSMPSGPPVLVVGTQTPSVDSWALACWGCKSMTLNSDQREALGRLNASLSTPFTSATLSNLADRRPKDLKELFETLNGSRNSGDYFDAARNANLAHIREHAHATGLPAFLDQLEEHFGPIA